MENLTTDEWKQSYEKSKKHQIVDVRTPIEWSNGIIKGAVKIDFNQQVNFMNFIKQLDPSLNYYVYCKSGIRSWYACQIMDQLGLKTFNLKNGITQWNEPLINS